MSEPTALGSRRPLISVITPFLNTQRFIEEAIQSVLAQSYDAWELLLVDDGSTDTSSAIARHFASQYRGQIRYLEHRGHDHRGASASRNLALSHARGEYVAFLDSDDVYVPEKLAQQVAILETHPDASMLYGNSRYWYSWTGLPEDAHRDIIPNLGVPLDTLFSPPSLLTVLYPLGTTTAPGLNTVMVRRAVAERLGGFTANFTLAYTDQSFLVRLYLKEPIFVSSHCWDYYRQHPDSSGAIVERTGQYVSIRRTFLLWLKEYLTAEGVTDPTVWTAFEAALKSVAPA